MRRGGLSGVPLHRIRFLPQIENGRRKEGIGSGARSDAPAAFLPLAWARPSLDRPSLLLPLMRMLLARVRAAAYWSWHAIAMRQIIAKFVVTDANYYQI
jgi:hypothetical protein